MHIIVKFPSNTHILMWIVLFAHIIDIDHTPTYEFTILTIILDVPIKWLSPLINGKLTGDEVFVGTQV